MANTGNVFTFTDNPETEHPPDTSGSWALNSAGDGYGNGAGHTVYFDEITGDFDYYWWKVDDSTGQTIDEGYLRSV